MIQNLFSIDIYNTTFEDFDLLKKLSSPAYLDTFNLGKHRDDYDTPKGNSKSGLYSWHKIKDAEKVHLRPEFSPIKKFIEHHAKIYWDYLGYYKEISPKIYQSWVNLITPGEDGNIHNHGLTPLAGVLYLSAIPDQGNIVFENPMNLILSCLPNLNDSSQLHKQIPSTTGTLLLFPGYLKHFILSNNTNSDRVSYAVNLNRDGIFINKNFLQESK